MNVYSLSKMRRKEVGRASRKALTGTDSAWYSILMARLAFDVTDEEKRAWMHFLADDGRTTADVLRECVRERAAKYFTTLDAPSTEAQAT